MHLVAMDSFKGSLTTFEANAAVRRGLAALGYGEIRCFPMSDGGEGFSSVAAEYVTGSFFGSGRRRYFMSEDGVAYLEAAVACGYDTSEARTPLDKSSFALGEMMRDAASAGASKMVIGLGGTSTCDAGVGALQALGVKFICADGSTFPDGEPALLKDIAGMNAGVLDGWNIPVELWVDTDVPFCGMQGAVRVFGPQKGLKTDEVTEADAWMSRIAELFGLGELKGAGAAGGLGGALHALTGAEILSGAEQMIRLSCLREALCGAEMVITGEGRYDFQTSTGKLPYAISAAAMEASVQAVCVCGSAESASSPSFSRILPVSPTGIPLAEAMKKDVAENNIYTTIINCL